MLLHLTGECFHGKVTAGALADLAVQMVSSGPSFRQLTDCLQYAVCWVKAMMSTTITDTRVSKPEFFADWFAVVIQNRLFIPF